MIILHIKGCNGISGYSAMRGGHQGILTQINMLKKQKAVIIVQVNFRNED